MNIDNNNHPLTLADIFLTVMEQTAKDENQKEYIRRVRIMMGIPEYSEFLNCLVVNAMGNPTPIAATTVDKAVDCIIHFNEDNIENISDATKDQKDVEKVRMRSFMENYRISVKEYIAANNLLIW